MMERTFCNSTIAGEITLPGSKSYSHRALIASFIANKKTIIKNINFCDDVKETLMVLKALGGVFIEENGDIVFIKREAASNKISVEIKESASTLRFLLPLMIYLTNDVEITLSERLFNRGIAGYKDFLVANNVEIEVNKTTYRFKGTISENDIIAKETDSSQYLSGFLFLLSLFEKNCFLRLPSVIHSLPYLDMTIDTLKRFGIYFLRKDNLLIKELVYPSKIVYHVESDYSALAYFAVLGSIKGMIKVNDINLNSLQGDKKILSILMDMGELFFIDKDYLIFSQKILHGISIDIDNNIDLGPILMVLGSFAYGETTLLNTSRLVNKESDRLHNMVKELTKAGVDIQIADDKVIIHGKASYKGNNNFSTYHDHRIAMSLIIFALINNGVSTFDDLECIKKSYPRFLEDIDKIILK